MQKHERRQSYTSMKYMTHSDTFRFAAKCLVGSPRGNALRGARGLKAAKKRGVVVATLRFFMGVPPTLYARKRRHRGGGLFLKLLYLFQLAQLFQRGLNRIADTSVGHSFHSRNLAVPHSFKKMQLQAAALYFRQLAHGS